jgi:hypothetical protein
MLEGQTCKTCNEWKVLEEFTKDKRIKSGYVKRCRNCANKKCKNYYQDNKDLVLKVQKEYYEKNKEKILKREKIYNEKNKERITERRRANKETKYQQFRDYYQIHKKRLTEIQRENYQKNKDIIAEKSKIYRQKNKEKISKREKAYRQTEKGRDLMYRSYTKRRAYKHKVQFTPHERKQILDRDNWECQTCRVIVHDDNVNNELKCHIDHIIPISKGGNSTPKNLRVLCRTCNLTKSDKVDEQLKLIL